MHIDSWPREAKYLYGHSGLLTIELEDTVDPVVTGFAHACKDGFKKAWEVLLIIFFALCQWHIASC